MILGSRGSPLALWQTNWVRDRLMAEHPGLEVSIEIIRTTGDRRQQTEPGPEFGGDKGIFVKEIEEALLESRIDAAVHSLKDLPTEQPEGLVVTAIPAREDPRDALVTRDGASMLSLPAGSRVGTSSPRRAAQLAAFRPGLHFSPVRGNVDTRILKMVEGKFDAVVLAAAGLRRLGYVDGSMPGNARVWMIPEEICLPAVGQGALAIECRAGDAATRSSLRVLHDEGAAAEVNAERAFLAAMGGGCRVPVAARAVADCEGNLSLRGVVAAPDGSRVISVVLDGPVTDAHDLGRRLGLAALERGAGEIIKAFSGTQK